MLINISVVELQGMNRNILFSGSDHLNIADTLESVKLLRIFFYRGFHLAKIQGAFYETFS